MPRGGKRNGSEERNWFSMLLHVKREETELKLLVQKSITQEISSLT
ncbi:hypothetical protein NC651_030176 [Populus alba x Populus x berolinensis]|nr:hypothetical protein NC651_030176 [Populus alba x Populus x berolinensis]